MPVFNNALAGAAGSGGAAAYEIERSLRFNSADSAYLNRTPSSAGNRKTWTWSGWFKRTKLGTVQGLFSAITTPGSNTDRFTAFINTNDKLYIIEDASGTNYWAVPTQVFRDVSAWYHLVFAFDTTISTPTSDRVKVYVNGDEVTSFTLKETITENRDTFVNSTLNHYIGLENSSDYPSKYWDGYLADVHFIDGQALEASDFGEYDNNNVWQPKAYTGTYGTNGFYLDFSDNSSNAALGTDAAGSNDWTVNNITAQAPTASYDSSHGSNITSTEAAKIFDSDDSTYGVATGDLVGFAYSGSSVTMKVENTNSSQVDFYIQPNVSNSATNQGTWGGQSAGTVSSNQWFIPANTTATATFTFPATWDNDGRIYLNGNSSSLRLYSMDAGRADYVNIDSLIDTPTNYEASSGNNGGNYATLNPLDKDSSLTLSNGNLDFTGGATPNIGCRSTFFITSGKYYWEVTNVSGGGGNFKVGIAKSAWPLTYVGVSDSFGYSSSGVYFPSNSGATATAANTAGDVVGVAFDADNGTLDIYVNGTSLNTASGWGTIPSDSWSPAFASGISVNNSVNFGQRPFAYTPPTGFKALCTTNLPDPTIADGSTAMDAKLYTSNNSTLAVTGYNFSPDFVWIKNRTTANHHGLFDIVRGANKLISSNRTNAEITTSGSGYGTGTFNSFDSNGFTLGDDVGANVTNYPSGDPHVAWAWDSGTSTVSNTDGSTTSQVRANPTAGFSIVSYTGNSTAGATIGHGLNAQPSFILIKNRDRSTNGNWAVGHIAANTFTEGDLNINTTNSQGSGYDGFFGANPTSSTFRVNANFEVNYANEDYIAYCWAPVEGYSAFGSYTGNGSADGPFVYTGFRPAFVVYKRTDSTGNWFIFDTARNTYNTADEYLKANQTDAEQTLSSGMDILSNGFRQTATTGGTNASGGTYIYAAFAENPFKTARAR